MMSNAQHLQKMLSQFKVNKIDLQVQVELTSPLLILYEERSQYLFLKKANRVRVKCLLFLFVGTKI